ncbi:MAG: mono/diheme cytochrome c family protein [Candidatus Paceibacteria bacterium]|jgi:mono/diheme cytochrome c family protein
MAPLITPRKRNLSRGLLVAIPVLLLSSANAQGQVPSDPSVRVPIEHWGCSNCHEPDTSNSNRVGKRPGPDLSGVGGRISADWMKRWIGNPGSLRAAPTMPRLFGEPPTEQADLDALVHFLASLDSAGEPSAPAPLATEPALLARGNKLYHTIGCIACHGALDSPATVFEDEYLSGEVPDVFVFGAFADLGGKWYPRALSAFLRDPLAVHPDGRMPAMNLSEEESDAIANYLLSKWGPATAANSPDAQQLERGREVLLERDCLACHVLEGVKRSDSSLPKLAQLNVASEKANCISGTEWDGPRYDFPASAMAGMLKLGVQAANQAQVADPMLDYLARQTDRLNCNACHESDGEGGLPEALRPFAISLAEDADLGDEGRYPPHLNGVGAKLTTPWFEEVLQSSGRTRPYLSLRMPQFGAAVQGFPELFAMKAGVKPNADREWPSANDQQILKGREMVGADGFSCITCHSFGDYPSIGTPGPDMQQFAGHLRYEWWDAYIKNPEAFKPGTRMPSYTDDQGHGVFTKYYAGDFQMQTDSLWSYFTLGDSMSPPTGVERKQSLVLRVSDRPRVFRTFLDSTGSRGIAVGFPVGIHFAYDAAGAGLTEVWQGGFVDASGAWAGRGGNSTGTAGDVLWTKPEGPAFVLGDPETNEVPDTWPTTSEFDYKGYRLEKNGTPVFLWQLGEVRLEERIVPKLVPKRHLEVDWNFYGLKPERVVYLRPDGPGPHTGLRKRETPLIWLSSTTTELWTQRKVQL